MCEIKNTKTGEMETSISHGVDENLKSHILPEKMSDIWGTKYDEQLDMTYIEDNNNEDDY